MAKTNEQVLCSREGCGHQREHHATNPSKTIGGCLGCLKCSVFLESAPPQPDVTLTADQYEGMKNNLSFANSQIEELADKNAKLEQLRRDSAARESLATRSNFDLMRQAARLEAKLLCAQGVHGVTVGRDETEQCKECGRMVNDESWRNRPPVNVSLEAAPRNFVGPFILITPEEREFWAINWDKGVELNDSYLDRIIELETTFGVETDNDDLMDEIESDQKRQADIESEDVLGEDGIWQRLVTFGEE